MLLFGLEEDSMSTSPNSPAAAPAPATVPRRRRGRLRLVLGTTALLGLLLFAGWIWLMLRFSYSAGERAGYVQKFSRKGWICKTWEGELAMASLPGTMPQVVTFTAWDDGVASQINALMGQRVVLHYEEKVGLPTSCFGETRHIVTAVRVVQ